MVEITVDPFPTDDMLRDLWRKAWDDAGPAAGWQNIMARSLAHIGAYEGPRLVGFVNVAWDGGVHAFILDTCVDADFQRRGIALRLLKAAEDTARARGAEWLHVDFEPRLTALYRSAGFRPTEAGLMAL